jgi:hypothetical protein
MKKNLRINRLLKYWNYLNILRTNGILIFCQNLSLNAFKDWQMSIYLNDLNYKWKVLNKKIIKNIINKKFLNKIKNFNYVLIIHNINFLKDIEKYLKKNEILILGYYIQNIFFFKKDFEIKKKEKKFIIDNLKKRTIQFYKKKTKILLNLKYLIIKFILLLKKKNGNN